ncbi:MULTISPECIES: hypothetical protein [Psychrilyobacter]|uniref:Uncharacterized protein n=1 Tax=Psychrilyobacter piezotolerans TaxID=2293438 RepID=A0ABX9KHN1_9FUSO|nr:MULTISPECIES: hypothetical protein [Psychrilyobacter]MCS5422998.1 hypothetical protein [Psychrilyobacter sp. S5]NDI77813.1 hypothetical protein [Psychrilyobacter piezotolerans]RDE62334.1 hypothetical protein DV867_07115 [Psychrilyobacter sp. S5]REI41432.1 hypothetical protein DYH56_07115 [Psychrilyobacter piezotolerans]
MLCSTFIDLINVIDPNLFSSLEVLELKINSLGFEVEQQINPGIRNNLKIKKEDMFFHLIYGNLKNKIKSLIFHLGFSKGKFYRMSKEELKKNKEELLIRFPILNDNSKYEVKLEVNYIAINFLK